MNAFLSWDLDIVSSLLSLEMLISVGLCALHAIATHSVPHVYQVTMLRRFHELHVRNSEVPNLFRSKICIDL